MNCAWIQNRSSILTLPCLLPGNKLCICGNYQPNIQAFSPQRLSLNIGGSLVNTLHAMTYLDIIMMDVWGSGTFLEKPQVVLKECATPPHGHPTSLHMTTLVYQLC